MPSFIAHMLFGLLFAELYILCFHGDIERNKKITLRVLGSLGGLLPDLDVIPALILGLPMYSLHHYFTHTFLAILVVSVSMVIIRKKESFVLGMGYLLHLGLDLVDNSLPLLSPFILEWEFGLNIGHVFEANNWGFYTNNYFVSYYDLVFIILAVILHAKLIIDMVKSKLEETVYLEESF